MTFGDCASGDALFHGAFPAADAFDSRVSAADQLQPVLVVLELKRQRLQLAEQIDPLRVQLLRFCCAAEQNGAVAAFALSIANALEPLSILALAVPLHATHAEDLADIFPGKFLEECRVSVAESCSVEAP